MKKIIIFTLTLGCNTSILPSAFAGGVHYSGKTELSAKMKTCVNISQMYSDEPNRDAEVKSCIRHNWRELNLDQCLGIADMIQYKPNRDAEIRFCADNVKYDGN